MALYFEERGDKAVSTIVFIHGGGMSGWMWEKQLEHFKDYHCLVTDLPEHGKNISKEHISIRNCASQVAELIEKHANGGKAHVVGHSLGAKVIIELLSIRPEVVDHAVVASGLFRPIPLMELTHKPSVYRLTSYMLKLDWYMSLTAKQFKFPNKTYHNNFVKEFKTLTAERLYRIYDELYKNISLPKNLDNVKVPTLVIAGEKEPKAMRQSVVDMVNVIPNSEGILMKSGLHTYPWVMYEEFNKIIEDWINNKQVKSESVVYLQ